MAHDHGFSEKRGKVGDGYKVHLTETCGSPPEGVNLITNVATTAAPLPDAVMTEPVHDMLAALGLVPGVHAAGAGYAGTDQLLAAQDRGITLLARCPQQPSWACAEGEVPDLDLQWLPTGSAASGPLQHSIEVRHRTCSFRSCRRAAVRCNLDHTIPHQAGGAATCRCHLAPASKS